MINTSYWSENHEKQRETNSLIPQTYALASKIKLTFFMMAFLVVHIVKNLPAKKKKKKESACNAGDLGLIPGLGRFPGEGDGYPLQYSCLENPMDREAWWATVHGVAKSWAQLSN